MIMVSLIPVKSMKFLLKIIIRQAILIVHVSLDHNVFYGTLGQSRNYTISYKLKDGVTIEQLQRELSDRLTFSSWLETDYLDSRDNGSANNRLMVHMRVPMSI